MKVTRIATLLLHASMALLFLSPCTVRAEKQPNILFIMADDLGYGHLGCYGQPRIHTPNLDRLARQGMRFTQYYAGFTVCAPSRSVLMTGLHHGHSPIRSNSGSSSLLENEITVAQVLQKAGYRCGGFGKWGLGVEGTPGRPSRKGFDEFYGFYHQVHAHFYYPYWIWHNDEKMMLPGNDNGRRNQYVPDLLHERAMAFVRDSARRKKPFFCYIPSIIPHVELAVPEDSLAPYRGAFPRKTLNDPRTGYLGSDDAYSVYAGMISRLDRQVGEILALLDRLAIAENTIVFFTSDNGPQFGRWQALYNYFDGSGPLRGGKGSLFEGGIRVPFIVRWPGKIKPGAINPHIGGFQDILPTLCELAQVESPPSDGISILPTLLDEQDRQREHDFLFWGGETRALRMGRWKGVKEGPSPWQLYDLRTDLGEQHDVASRHPELVREIDRLARQAYTPPREQIEGHRPSIRDYVRGPRIHQKNAR